jgi:hypothetical protein
LTAASLACITFVLLFNVTPPSTIIVIHHRPSSIVTTAAMRPHKNKRLILSVALHLPRPLGKHQNENAEEFKEWTQVVKTYAFFDDGKERKPYALFRYWRDTLTRNNEYRHLYNKVVNAMERKAKGEAYDKINIAALILACQQDDPNLGNIHEDKDNNDDNIDDIVEADDDDDENKVSIEYAFLDLVSTILTIPYCCSFVDRYGCCWCHEHQQ